MRTTYSGHHTSHDASHAISQLTKRYLLDFPAEAAHELEALETIEAATSLNGQNADVLMHVFGYLTPHHAADLLLALEPDVQHGLLSEMPPGEAATIAGQLTEDDRMALFAGLNEDIRADLERTMSYPTDSAGHMMDTHFAVFRQTDTVEQALETIRQKRLRTTRSVFLVDDANRLTARVTVQDLAVSRPSEPLHDIAIPVVASVDALMPRDQVADVVDKTHAADLPVTDFDGRVIGMLYHDKLVQAVAEDATADLQTMVGASADERALSPPLFAVRKRLPWLQINLLTAFMAAAVVGIFEETIAAFTALAVLLPVVAGQSGNTGAQALAVTMRGLALREISLRQWKRVMTKEAVAGFVNGLAVAATCGIGVYLWSGSLGLVAVIMSSMVMAMVMAGLAGAVVPIVLTRLGQDPATASSIILTTVTDIAGFFSFLGIATLLMAFL
ncbi:magnesium transporter [Pyruvatibacter sp.]|uniref:magnesium transporter n=1 Tax=Pyruvatibacter sp. TaxID=1981328 RepID=UPI0032EE74FE